MSRSELEAELKAILENAVSVGVPGITATIRTSTGIIFESAHGSAILPSDTRRQVNLAVDHLFGIGSVTKVFVSIVILQLIEEQVLELSSTISDLLDGSIWRGIGNVGSTTVEELLSHHSGIQSWEDDPLWIVEGRGINLIPSKIWGKKEALQYIRPSVGLVKGRYSYANTNYTLLGLIIEKITGCSAESEIRKRILTPLGLTNTYLEGFEKGNKEKVASRYHFATQNFKETAGICPDFTEIEFNGTPLIDATVSNLSVEWGAGGMISSTADLSKFALALRDGKLLSSSSMTTLFNWKPKPEETFVEVGTGIFKLCKDGNSWIGHGGNVLGFSAAMWWLNKVEGDCVVTILANVGSMHAGSVPSSAGNVALRTDFGGVAKRLAALDVEE